jgi:hypothetical protein
LFEPGALVEAAAELFIGGGFEEEAGGFYVADVAGDDADGDVFGGEEEREEPKNTVPHGPYSTALVQ